MKPKVQIKPDRRPLDDNDRLLLTVLHESGANDWEIAAAMRVSKSCISSHRRRLGLKPNLRPRDYDQFKEHCLPAHKVAEITGSKPSSLDQAMIDLGGRLSLRKYGKETLRVLDGKIGATVQQVIAEANRLRLAEGKPILGRVMP